MISIVSGIAGIASCLFVWDAVDKSSGFRAALFGGVALICFGLTIAGTTFRPSFNEDCERFSSFASSCD